MSEREIEVTVLFERGEGEEKRILTPEQALHEHRLGERLIMQAREAAGANPPNVDAPEALRLRPEDSITELEKTIGRKTFRKGDPGDEQPS